MVIFKEDFPSMCCAAQERYRPREPFSGYRSSHGWPVTELEFMVFVLIWPSYWYGPFAPTGDGDSVEEGR